jgi:hypothetical protein
MLPLEKQIVFCRCSYIPIPVPLYCLSYRGYGLDDRVIEVRSPAGAEDFSSRPSVQTGSEAHPASYPMGTGGPFPGVKRDRGVTLTTHPHLVAEVKFE